MATTTAITTAPISSCVQSILAPLQPTQPLAAMLVLLAVDDVGATAAAAAAACGVIVVGPPANGLEAGVPTMLPVICVVEGPPQFPLNMIGPLPLREETQQPQPKQQQPKTPYRQTARALALAVPH